MLGWRHDVYGLKPQREKIAKAAQNPDAPARAKEPRTARSAIGAPLAPPGSQLGFSGQAGRAPPAPREELSEAERQEIYDFVHTVGVSTVLGELHAQGQTHVTRADVEKMSEARHCDLMGQAAIREAESKIKAWR